MNDFTLMTTAEVAEEAESSEAEARAWAQENGVQLFGNAYAWSPQDVADFLDDLEADDLEAEDLEADGDEDDAVGDSYD
jgi:hypothetical protein